MNDVKLYDIGSIVFFVLGSLTFILTYTKASMNKADKDRDTNTIESLTRSNAALTEERNMWKEKADNLQGQNKVLQETVTAAPQIVKLTTTIAKHQAENAKWQKATTKLMKMLIAEIRDEHVAKESA